MQHNGGPRMAASESTMSDGPRSRRPVDIKSDEESDATGAESETSRPLRPTRSARPPKVDTGSSRASDAPPTSRRDSGTPPRRSKTPKPPGVTPKPPSVTPKPPAAKTAGKAKAKGSRSRRKADEPRGRLDSHAEGFFAEGEAAANDPGHTHAHDDEPALPVHSIFAAERRNSLVKYVGIALAISTVLCVLALIHAAMAPSTPHEAAVATSTAAATPTALPPPSSITPIPPVSAAASIAPPPAAPASAAASAAAPPADSAAAAVASAAPEVPAKSAAQEKADAQKALERGKNKDAVDAASRSVALDPTDADAWLILGAANMELGKTADARAAFGACVKQSTKGQIGECRSMMR